MTKEVRWDPRRDLLAVRDAVRDVIDTIFEEGIPLPRGPVPVPIDMYETKTDVVIKATLVGVKPEDLDVSITGDVLTIKGKSEFEEEVEEENFIRRERRFGAFSRQVTIPIPVIAEKAEAKLKDGVLTITIPKAEDVRPQVINVKTAE